MLERVIITATGMQGSGKTTKVRELVARCRRALFVDPEGKWAPQLAGDVVVRGAGALTDYLAAIGATDPAIPFRVIYRGDDVKRMAHVGPSLAFGIRNLTLVCDEWAWLCRAQYITPYLERCIQFGRERFISMVGTTREPQEVHNMLFTQANLVLVFRTRPGYGLDRLRRWYPAIASEAPNLNLHEYRADGDESCVQLLGREGLARRRRASVSMPPSTRSR